MHDHNLELVVEPVQWWYLLVQALTLTAAVYDLRWFTLGIVKVSLKHLPMVKHALWESLSSSVSTKCGGKTCR